MAYLEEALYSAAQSHSGLVALIGGGDSIRFYPPGAVPPTCDEPYCVYSRVSGHREHTMVTDPGLAAPRIQISAFAKSYKACKDVAAQLINCFQDWSGTVAGVVVQRAFLEGDADIYDPDSETHQVAVDFIVWHEE